MSDSQREALRQKALAEIALLDTPPEREFDALARLAQRLLGTSMSSVTLIDPERQWFKARCGPLAPWTERGPALCTVVFESEQPLTIADARLDPRFAGNPFVVGEPHIRFYAGVPVRVRQVDGEPVTIGTLCVLDDRPRVPQPADIDVLAELACVAEALVEARAVAVRASQAAEERRLANERLERERRQFKQAERLAEMGSWRYDIVANVTSWSDGIFAIHELPAAGGVPNAEIMSFFPEPDRSLFLETVKRTLDTGEPFEMDAAFVTAKGRPRRVRVSCEIELSKGQPVALIGMLQDITERYGLEERLRRQARTDDLTQLANRAEFHRVLDQRLREARDRGGELAVLLIDLDGFKGVNDALGHAAGDDVLRRVADRLRQSGHDNGLPARLGGDEFAVIVPQSVGRADLMPMVERLLRDLHIVVSEAGQIARVTGTIGIAWSSEAGGDRERLLRHADDALYAAKRSCKGTARTFTEAGRERSAG
ncbi:sensor domain-containing diguanylate cyclase [Aureimonas jatrophae]|uniref:PAS domain S-box-containing protein/diguanylate cyclase (GGDEF) domain-containing protein n=1 Tax=Aureimonas jatrophae TaxID=1166073 RepID=A0A1H0FP32_9HYPH|nr:sensor domain-containing diguanylate cyclase [Aureimonas jatrophae]MBB3949925.1 diguanylate cyclase (GGDEF)-like protein [Aureimonas jatrophae]SDN96390.1 PAS domain S-box-containing protein/diguanylate cyclase (GGDEF) domain-containing protein [Aureimonas jatrophae]